MVEQRACGVSAFHLFAVRAVARAGALGVSLALAGCAADGDPAVADARLSVTVAPLSLPGVGVACYDIAVSNGAGLVWSRGDRGATRLEGDATTLCSDAFGNGAGGDLAYVGTCDASADADPLAPGVQNVVTLWVDGLYDAAVSADVGEWIDPCPDGCALSVDCVENADALVRFDLTIMRDANQGFFDVAVDFEDVFCSAKLDSCNADGDPMRLLFGGDLDRDHTAVFGFACSAGPDAATVLAYSVVTVTCDGATFVVDPTRGPGEVAVTAAGHTLHYGVYRGAEQLDCGTGPGSCAKRYWNLALDLADLAPLGTCRLALSATATDGDQGFSAGLPTAAGVSYPYVEVDAALTEGGAALCQQHGLGDGPVQTTYHGALGGLTPASPLCYELAAGVAQTVPGTFVAGATCAACDPTAPFAGGSGTIADPYLICARSHLERVSQDLAAHYRQVADLALGAAPFTPLGPAAFTGTYDGAGHTIAGLTIDAPTDTLAVGLFRELGVGAHVHDLALPGVDITGNNFVGAIAGRSSGVVSDVAITGDLAGNATVGGVVGHQYTAGAKVERATVTAATIYSSASGTAVHPIGGSGLDTAAAGIAAIVYDGGAVIDCTVDANITWDPTGPGHAQGWTYAGGIVGYGNGATISGCRASGRVVGKLQTGGILGASDGDATTLVNCHADVEVHGDSWVGGLAGISYGHFTNVSATGDVVGRWDVGGLFGTFVGGVIREASASGDVIGAGATGGLIGRDVSYRRYAGEVYDAWASGAVTVTDPTGVGGGFVGVASAAGARGTYPPVFTACASFSPSVTGEGGTALGAFQGSQIGDVVRVDTYALKGAGVPSQSLAGLTMITATEAVAQSTYAGFDFAATWRMTSANPLVGLATPVLAWECGLGVVACQ